MNNITPSPELYNSIMSRIEYEQRLKKLKNKLVFSVCVTIFSSFVFTILFKDFSHQAAQTGFMQFASLLFSDFRVVVAHLSDYLLSVADSLPVISFGLVSLAVLTVVMGMIKILNYLLEVKKLRHSTHI